MLVYRSNPDSPVLTVNPGETVVFELEPSGFLPTNVILEPEYRVSGDDGKEVPLGTWVAAGGSVSVAVVEEKLEVTLTGAVIPGVQSYSLATIGNDGLRRARFDIWGVIRPHRETKKADSKGRVSVGYPGSHFTVTYQGDEIRLGLIEPVEAMPYPIPGDAVRYLESFGLNSEQVLRDEANSEGYWEADLDDEGKRVYEFGSIRKTRKPWPEGFDWNIFVALGLRK